MSEEEEILDLGMFEEPADFRPPAAEHHFALYERVTTKAPSTINLRLVGKSPLWGHLLWNAGKYTANYIDEHAEELVRGKRILELGAAAALPSLICGLNGASEVICTDYPDPDLIENIQYNVDHCQELSPQAVKVRGYIWGGEKAGIYGVEEKKMVLEDEKFDLIILSDLVFNHTEHLKLLQDCRDLLKRDGKVFVVFSPHRPRLLSNDLEFFKTAEQYEFKSVQNDLVIWKPMFEEDDETAEIRARVYSYFLIPQWIE
ncbi:Protein N-terminal and lysine N-methyltransferase efm7 [Yamadazyma tenuis]|uniref:Protein N-terminal and lysine N-methyltransferase EFM7 n=1 Tax=Candida tenuis (strain ATCC 10573 / BCRC 21748 / CBS 615 / JCM 9827 / NBRC 10315 / NRRL Y-1498 / VKM Y-70) TaxID=590646 RepID=G3BFF6_CANTC|nr:uncharacterized protein CANTEDRAFT_111326 [Yamadazyma tenuis ATCC 10573]EGV60679.1 hypothetical protein CANTEDRAFT_111326 [Yamadazyma tenuis ATCC 10573]WEJ94068.1 Protein N-terminal and lysine N-methyltransferase efm7 [Yamadazyma tenuis]